jgi:acyl-CoA thioester hydrolase
MKLPIAMLKLPNLFAQNYRIYYEDTDAGGIVYHPNYLKFFERARTEFLRSKDIVQSELVRLNNLLFVVRKIEIEYLSSARLDETIIATVKSIEFRRSSIIMTQEILKDDKVISTLQIVLVAISNISFTPIKIPKTITSKFN